MLFLNVTRFNYDFLWCYLILFNVIFVKNIFSQLLPSFSQTSSLYIIEPSDKTVVEGDEVILLCKIKREASPAYWTRDDVKVNVDTLSYSFIGSQADGEYHLRIHRATMSRDSGRWKCRTAQGSGRESKGAILNVILKDTSFVSDVAKYKPPQPQQPLITKIKAFHYCTHDRILVTIDFPFSITTKLIGRNQTCSLQIENKSTVSFFIPYFDCGTTNSITQSDHNSTQTKFSNYVAMSYDKATITHYFDCFFPKSNSARYYTEKLGTFDLSAVPVPFKRTLPKDCPIEIENPYFSTHIECGWQTGFTIVLSFSTPFTGKIFVSERGECEYSVIDQRNVTIAYAFDRCGAERFIEQGLSNTLVIFRNTLYIEQHCTVGSAALRVMRCELPQ